MIRDIARFAVLALVLAGAGCTDGTGDSGGLTEGTWGGEHIRMTVAAGAGAAALEYDCAHGTMQLPVDAGDGGSFTASGTHTRESGGPLQENDPQESHPARYEGIITGSSMRLSLTLTDTGETLGPFSLTWGDPGQIFKCL